MAKVDVDGRMTLELPTGFSVMDKADVQRAFGFGYDDVWGARHERRNIMVAVIWKDAPALLGKLVSTKALVERAEKALRKTYAKHDYHYDGPLQLQVDGDEALGFSYRFMVGDVAQQGEVIIFRRDKRTYTLYYYTRPERAKANWAVHDALLSSISLGN